MSYARPTARSILAAAALAAFAGSAAAQEKLTFNLGWLPQGSTSGPVIALANGYFKDAGLDVSIVRGYGGTRTANELDQGQFDVGYTDPISIAINRSNGGKIRMIGAINTQWPAGICFDTRRHMVKKPADMKGMTLGGGSASVVHNVVPVWLEQNGQPKDLVRLLRMDPAVVDASLVEGKIDLAECWRASNRAVMLKQAAAAGVDVGWIEYADFGLNAYGSGFVTTDDVIAKRGEALRKFLQASYKGYEFAIRNPEQAADIMVRSYPTVDRAVVLAQIRDIIVLVVDPQAKDQGLGYMRDDRMASTVQFVDKAFSLAGKVKPQDVYTNALLK
ncbi:MAG: ABC transporter substrate-binding protein [Burkholderiales bacterium]|nr:ABC transporter substrate-binding protein [Burkholderiales bacterium]MCE7876047.1 nitrate ABC transporter permease [Betaproteobacteria bacterium PRO3]